MSLITPIHAQAPGKLAPDRIAAGGGSAGGQLAAATATAKSFEEPGENPDAQCRPDALVLFNPVIDNGPGGYGHDRVKTYWEAFSPLHNIDRTTPPTVFFLGTKDHLETAEKFKQLMEENGRRCDLHLYEDQSHGFFNSQNRKNYFQTVTEMDRLLASLGYLEGPPTPCREQP